MLTFSFFRRAHIKKVNSKKISRMAVTRVGRGRSIEGILGKEGMDKLGKLGMWV